MLSVARPVVMFSFHERSFIISSLAAAIRAPGDALIETMSARRVRLVLVRFFFSHTVASNPCPAHDMSLTAQESEREREKKGPVKKDEWHTLSRWTLSLCYFFFSVRRPSRSLPRSHNPPLPLLLPRNFGVAFCVAGERSQSC